jgi:hypothetical protein
MIAGENVSPALGFNPLDFRVLIVLTAYGIMALWREKRAILLPFLVTCGSMFVMTMLIWIEARIRAPIIAAMIPLAAYGVDDILRGFRRIAYWEEKLLLTALLALGLTVFWIFENYLPRDVTVDALPENAQAIDALYNDELRLVGYRIEDQYTDRGHLEPFRPYVVTLYWMLAQPSIVNYSYALKFVVEGEALDQFDYPLGYVSYPYVPTSLWEPHRIYTEHIGMIVDGFDYPSEISGSLLLEVYPEQNTSNLLEPVGYHAAYIELARPAFIWGEGAYFSFSPSDDSSQHDLDFGGLLTLKAWSIPICGHPSEPFHVDFAWSSTSVQIQESHSIGIYLFDGQGNVVSGFDAPLRNGDLLTNSLPTNYRIEDQRGVLLPDQTATYDLYIAVYRQSDGMRLPVGGTSDSLALLGTIEVSETCNFSQH